MFAAVPNLGGIAAGWTVHPYGPRPSGSRDSPDSSIRPRRSAARAPIFLTEWGIATDNGRHLSDNYDWPTDISYARWR